MKKYLLGTFAVALALSMSAFTSAKKSLDLLYYKDSSGTFIPYTGEGCPQGNDEQCVVNIDGTPRALFTQPDDGHPSMTRQ